MPIPGLGKKYLKARREQPGYGSDDERAMDKMEESAPPLVPSALAFERPAGRSRRWSGHRGLCRHDPDRSSAYHFGRSDRISFQEKQTGSRHWGLGLQPPLAPIRLLFGLQIGADDYPDNPPSFRGVRFFHT